MTSAPLPRLLIARLPFHYGWLILACVCCAGFARQGPAVATLSIFVEPMTREFGWSRTALSGAVSLGGVLGALSAPILGPALDRHGARLARGAAGPAFRRAGALRPRAFWLLAPCPGLVYPVQAGASLHQAAPLIERGIAPTTAAAVVSTFSVMSAVTSLACAFLPRALPLRYPLALCGALFGGGMLAMISVATPTDGFIARSPVGVGIGGHLTLGAGGLGGVFCPA